MDQFFKAIDLKKDAQLLFWTTLSAILNAVSLTSFSMQAKLYPGGFSGISRILVDLCADFFNLNVPFGLFYLGLNILPTIMVFRYIGKRFTIYSVIQFTLVSFLTGYFKPIIQVDDLLLLSIFGGITNGFAIGLALQHNASSGGTDFIAIYVSHHFHRPIWNYVMACNAFILCIAGLIYGWERALYSIILQFCSTQVVSRMHNRYRMQTLTVITKYKDEVIQSVLKGTRHGITEIEGKGAYSHSDVTMLYTVVNSFQTGEVVDSILKADPKAFINIQDTKSVVGNYYQKPLD